MENLIFNGSSTVDMGVRIQTPPVYEFPNGLFDVIHIEGRNGDLIIDKKSYQNVKRTYNLALGFRKGSNFVTNARMIVEWLLSTKGYARLEDSYEPDYYRMASFEEPGEMINYFDDATVLTVSFNCKPQRYLKTGDEPKIITETDIVTPEGAWIYIKMTNPTNYISLPEITLNGDDVKIYFYSGEDYNNPKTVSTLINTYSSEFKIDSEMQDCYTNSQYVNSYITLENGFPKLYSGTNWIKVEATTFRKLEIKPRWWTL